MKHRSAFFIIALLLMIFLSISNSLPLATGSKKSLCPFTVVKVSWGDEEHEIDAAPGDTNIPLRVTFQNISNSTVSGLSQQLYLEYPFSNVSGGKIARSFCESSVSPGESATVQFLLNIDRQAASGEYVLKMAINYLEIASGVGKMLYILKSAEVDVPALVRGVRYMVIYSVNVYPNRASPGGKVTVSGNILNSGTLSALNTNITATSPILRQGSFAFVGQVDSNIPRPFSIPIQVPERQSKGQFLITITVTYVDELGIGHISFAETVLLVEEEGAPSPIPVKRPKTFLEMIVDILRRVWEALFGALSLVHVLREPK
ncbi:MAG: hypothetical protein QW265_00245 [Candidatus Bathyarchaeia archaeon]